MEYSLIQILCLGFSALLGAVGTFLLCTHTNLSKVQASTLPTFIFSIVIYLLFRYHLLSVNYALAPAVFFGGTFIGMTSSKIIRLWEVVMASIIFVLIWLCSQDASPHFGGKIGLIACIAVIITIGMRCGQSMLVLCLRFLKQKRFKK